MPTVVETITTNLLLTVVAAVFPVGGLEDGTLVAAVFPVAGLVDGTAVAMLVLAVSVLIIG